MRFTKTMSRSVEVLAINNKKYTLGVSVCVCVMNRPQIKKEMQNVELASLTKHELIDQNRQQESEFEGN